MSLGKKTTPARRRTAPVVPPYPHPSGAVAPAIPAEFVPRHVAIVMDGNGRWANQRGLPRIEGHKAGEPALLDVVAGAIELGIKYVTVYAFSTENWRRSPEEVRFLMGFNKDVLRRQRNQLDEWGVRVRWSGRRPKLWGSVIRELEEAEAYTAGNSTCTLTMCVNYGGRAEIADAVTAIAEEVAAGRLKPGSITEKTVQKFLDEPDLPDVDLFLRSSGSSGCPTSCSGSRRTRSSCSWTRSGRTSTAARSGMPWASTPSGTAATGERWMPPPTQERLPTRPARSCRAAEKSGWPSGSLALLGAIHSRLGSGVRIAADPPREPPVGVGPDLGAGEEHVVKGAIDTLHGHAPAQ